MTSMRPSLASCSSVVLEQRAAHRQRAGWRPVCWPMQHYEQGTVGTHEKASIFHDRADNCPGRVGQAYSTEAGRRIVATHESRLVRARLSDVDNEKEVIDPMTAGANGTAAAALSLMARNPGDIEAPAPPSSAQRPGARPCS